MVLFGLFEFASSAESCGEQSEATGSVASIPCLRLGGNQHYSEASFVSHHPSVGFCGICQRNGFDHRADSLQRTERKRVLRIY